MAHATVRAYTGGLAVSERQKGGGGAFVVLRVGLKVGWGREAVTLMRSNCPLWWWMADERLRSSQRFAVLSLTWWQTLAVCRAQVECFCCCRGRTGGRNITNDPFLTIWHSAKRGRDNNKRQKKYKQKCLKGPLAGPRREREKRCHRSRRLVAFAHYFQWATSTEPRGANTREASYCLFIYPVLSIYNVRAPLAVLCLCITRSGSSSSSRVIWPVPMAAGSIVPLFWLHLAFHLVWTTSLVSLVFMWLLTSHLPPRSDSSRRVGAIIFASSSLLFDFLLLSSTGPLE